MLHLHSSKQALSTDRDLDIKKIMDGYIEADMKLPSIELGDGGVMMATNQKHECQRHRHETPQRPNGEI